MNSLEKRTQDSISDTRWHNQFQLQRAMTKEREGLIPVSRGEGQTSPLQLSIAHPLKLQRCSKREKQKEREGGGRDENCEPKAPLCTQLHRQMCSSAQAKTLKLTSRKADQQTPGAPEPLPIFRATEQFSVNPYKDKDSKKVPRYNASVAGYLLASTCLAYVPTVRPRMDHLGAKSQGVCPLGPTVPEIF